MFDSRTDVLRLTGAKVHQTCTIPGTGRRVLHKATPRSATAPCMPTHPAKQVAPVSGHYSALVTQFGRVCNSASCWLTNPVSLCLSVRPPLLMLPARRRPVVLEGEYEHTCAYTLTLTRIWRGNYPPEIPAHAFLLGTIKPPELAHPPFSPDRNPAEQGEHNMVLFLARWYSPPLGWRAVSTHSGQ